MPPRSRETWWSSEVLDVDPLRAEGLHDRRQDPGPVGDVHLHAEQLRGLLERVPEELLALRRSLADPAREKAGVTAFERRLELLDAAPVLGERRAQLRCVVEEDVHPDARVRPRDAGHLAEGGARRGERVVPLDRRRADLVEEQVRERVREVADEREQAVVRLRVDRDGNRAERCDEGVQGAVAVALRRRVRGEEPRRAFEKVGRARPRGRVPRHRRPDGRPRSARPRRRARARSSSSRRPSRSPKAPPPARPRRPSSASSPEPRPRPAPRRRPLPRPSPQVRARRGPPPPRAPRRPCPTRARHGPPGAPPVRRTPRSARCR